MKKSVNEYIKCLVKFACLLEQKQKMFWLNRLADLLMKDLILEPKLTKRNIILCNIDKLNKMLGKEVLVHSRRLLQGLEWTLLAPRSFDNVMLYFMVRFFRLKFETKSTSPIECPSRLCVILSRLL